ncbi:MAG: hypothetical protein N3G19_01605 [Candidatus Pacearchaeota archaeon]|nr:hypothetical protein [Candidatus Pacearchaeota archaeon]
MKKDDGVKRASFIFIHSFLYLLIFVLTSHITSAVTINEILPNPEEYSDAGLKSIQTKLLT